MGSPPFVLDLSGGANARLDGEMGLDHRRDLRAARTPLEPRDRPPGPQKHERRDLADGEALRELGRPVGIDGDDAEPVALLRASCASTLSIRRAGPDRAVVKKRSTAASGLRGTRTTSRPLETMPGSALLETSDGPTRTTEVSRLPSAGI
jgi:hypothetical protein